MLSMEQQGFINSVLLAIKEDRDETYIMYLKGGAGTGKSEAINTLVDLLGNKKVLLTAMTHKASLRYTENKAITTHSAVGLNVVDEGSSVAGEDSNLLKQHNPRDLSGYILIVDEYSMVGKHMLEFIRFTRPSILILVGDLNQAKPVKQEEATFPKGHTTWLTKDFRSLGDLTEITAKINDAVGDRAKMIEVAHSYITKVPLKNISHMCQYEGYNFITHTNKRVLTVSNSLFHSESVYCKETPITYYIHTVNGDRWAYKNPIYRGIVAVIAERNQDIEMAGKPHQYEMKFRNMKALVKWAGDDLSGMKIPKYTKGGIMEELNVATWIEAQLHEKFIDAVLMNLPKGTGGMILKQQEGIYMSKDEYVSHIHTIKAYTSISSYSNYTHLIEDKYHRPKNYHQMLDDIQYVNAKDYEAGTMDVRVRGKNVTLNSYTNPHTGVYYTERMARDRLRAFIILDNIKTFIPEDKLKKFKTYEHGWELKLVLDYILTFHTLPPKSKEKIEKKYGLSSAKVDTFKDLLYNIRILSNALYALYMLNKQLKNVPCFIDSRVRTAHGAQGESLDNVIVDMKGLDKNVLYVALTRARKELKIVTDI